MKLRDLKLGDVVIIGGILNTVEHRFECESSDGEIYYHFPSINPFIKYTGREEIEVFQDKIYILKNERRDNKA